MYTTSPLARLQDSMIPVPHLNITFQQLRHLLLDRLN